MGGIENFHSGWHLQNRDHDCRGAVGTKCCVIMLSVLHLKPRLCGGTDAEHTICCTRICSCSLGAFRSPLLCSIENYPRQSFVNTAPTVSGTATKRQVADSAVWNKLYPWPTPGLLGCACQATQAVGRHSLLGFRQKLRFTIATCILWSIYRGTA